MLKYICIIFFIINIIFLFWQIFIYKRNKKKFKVKYIKRVKQNKKEDSLIWLYDVYSFAIDKISNYFILTNNFDMYKIKNILMAFKDLNDEIKNNYEKNYSLFKDEIYIVKKYVELINYTQDNKVKLKLEFNNEYLNLNIPSFLIFRIVSFMSMYDFDKKIGIYLFIRLSLSNDTATIAIEDTGTGLNGGAYKMLYKGISKAVCNKNIYGNIKFNISTSIEEGVKVLFVFKNIK